MKKHSEDSHWSFRKSKIEAFKKFGAGLESAMFNGFSNIIPIVSRLVCVHHLKKRDESKLLNLLESLQSRWEVLCPRFLAWFDIKRKSLFLEPVIQSSRENSDIAGLYYQNDIESQHAAAKRNQHFKKESILAAVSISMQ